MSKSVTRTDQITRDGVTVIRTLDNVGTPFEYVTDQVCASCGVQVIDDDRSAFYDADLDDGTPHVCPGKAISDPTGDLAVVVGALPEARRNTVLASVRLAARDHQVTVEWGTPASGLANATWATGTIIGLAYSTRSEERDLVMMDTAERLVTIASAHVLRVRLGDRWSPDIIAGPRPPLGA